MAKNTDPIDEMNTADWAAIATRSTIGQIPVAGSYLAEMAVVLIPNQRIDRIANFVKELERRLDEVPDGLLESLKGNGEFIDLIESAFLQASRARTAERRAYIASAVRRGVSDDTVKADEAKYLIGLLAELNDTEIVWLRYFHDRTMEDRYLLREKYPGILNKVIPTLGSSNDELEKAALQNSYQEHLERLGLIKGNISIDRTTGLPKYDKRTGKPEIKSSHTTTLGDILLRSVGLID